jgi:glutamate formiminotransferase/glutamate formiminotransferase/formiminotetrahydrofolate cyclodeaminase
MESPILLAVPNVSEGRDQGTIAAIGAAFADGPSGGARLLDVHSDRDHHRSVFTIAARAGQLAEAVLAGARVAVEQIDVMTRARAHPAERDTAEVGQHPHVGAVDVAPVVYLDPGARGAACAEALLIADRIGEELEVPVVLYGELSGADSDSARTRAQLRRGGPAGLAARMAGGEEWIAPDFGPSRMHPSAGATLLAARPPLVAFNLQLAPGATVDDAHSIAQLIREGGQRGLPGVRAIGLALSGGVAQVSMNVERPFEISLAMILDAVRAHAEVASAELVGLAPAAALEGFPRDIPIAGFDPARHLIENALGS